ncbi:adenosylcobinamide-GDP ribazoletransferase [Ascidiaceihabitans sp.]|uniref:adenosylcobinamide-GDP ribazoletransferase n=1 Tax=Ascidiaceihabitans sp. TaxID=1872644 RepID=UPI0032990642
MQKSDPSRSVFWQAIAAGALLTRLPLPHAPDDVFRHQARTVWAYPVWGVVLGFFGVAIALAALWLTGLPLVAAIAGLGAAMMMTGAMHEDGLADSFDGLWGGYTPERRLEIMKDSHIGTYGVLALVFSSGARAVMIAPLLVTAPMAVIAAMSLSRAMMPVVMAALPHARRTGLSHSVGQPVVFAAMLSVVLGGCISVVLAGWVGFAATLLAGLATYVVICVARAKIGGQTGDIVGATQVITELVILGVMVSAFTSL